jgi:putative DNA primase/helicase
VRNELNDEIITQEQVIAYLKKADAVNRFTHDDIGSARLISTILKKYCRFNATAREWFFYDGKIWGIDSGGLQIRKLTKTIAKGLIKYAVNNVENDDKYLKYAMQWNDAPKRNTLVNDARDLNFFRNEDFDKDNGGADIFLDRLNSQS